MPPQIPQATFLGSNGALVAFAFAEDAWPRTSTHMQEIPLSDGLHTHSSER
jgi:hypothetical protein